MGVPSSPSVIRFLLTSSDDDVEHALGDLRAQFQKVASQCGLTLFDWPDATVVSGALSSEPKGRELPQLDYHFLIANELGKSASTAETWSITVYSTRIPAISIGLVETKPLTKTGVIYSEAFARRVVEGRAADIAILFPRRTLIGVKLSVYFYMKIQSSKQLGRMLQYVPHYGSRRSALADLGDCAAKVSDDMVNECISVSLQSKARRAFVEDIDNWFVENIGRAAFARVIQATGLDVDQWLRLAR